MNRTIMICLILATGFSLSAQTIALSGKVTNQSGKAVSGAIVALTNQKVADTTDAAGAYSLTKGTSAAIPAPIQPSTEAISLNNGIVMLSLIKPAQVRIELFDMRGNLLERALDNPASAGDYRFDLMKLPLAANIMVTRVSIGQRTSSFRYLPLDNGKRAITSSIALSTGKRLAKAQATVDTLIASASGYTTKKVLISSYEGTMDITLDTAATVPCDPKDKTPAPTTVNVSYKGKALDGPHEVTVETDPGLPKFTIFRPKDLGPGKKYPIIAWGQGGCSTDGLSNPEFNAEFASFGYLSIADGTPNKGAAGGCGSGYSMDLKGGKCLLDAIHWAIKENSRPCSQYYQSLDTTKTAAFGWSCGGIMSEGAGSMKDPVLTTFMLNSSGQTSANQTTIDAFQKPVLFLLGGSGDMAYANGKRDYEAIKTGAVPAMLVSTGVGHGGTYTDDNGGSFAQVDLAWLNWWLKGDTGATGKGYLVGSTCSICSDSKWEIASKNLP
jgi:hypothetical protein